MERKGTVLLDMEFGTSASRMSEELEQRGLAVERCDGPKDARSCPMLDGQACEKVAQADGILFSLSQRKRLNRVLFQEYKRHCAVSSTPILAPRNGTSRLLHTTRDSAGLNLAPFVSEVTDFHGVREERLWRSVALEVLKARQERPRWVTLQSESVKFVDAHTMRRTITLDLSLQEILAGKVRPVHAGRLLLPIAVLNRDHDVGVKLLDETGSRLSCLGPTEERRLVASGIDSLCRVETEDAYNDTILDILRRPPESGHRYLEGWREQHHSLWEKPLVRTLIQELLDNYYLVALLDETTSPYRKVVLTYLEGLDGSRSKLAGTCSLRRSLRNQYVGVTGSRFFDAPDFTINFPALSDAGGYDLNVRTPSGLIAAERELQVWPSDESGRKDESSGGPLGTVSDTAKLHDVHFTYAGQPKGEVGLLHFKLPPETSGLVRPALASSCFALVVLIVLCGISLMRWQEQGGAFSSLQSCLDTSSLTPLLLVLPAVLTTYLARPPGEHDIRSWAVRGTRIAAVLVGLSLYGAAISNALRWKGLGLVLTWVLLIGVTVWSTIQTLRQYHRSKSAESGLARPSPQTGKTP